MSFARKCDICGEYYDVPAIEEYLSEPWTNTSMVRILRLQDGNKTYNRHDIMNFDACDKCLQDVLDYILSKQADSTITMED